MTGSIAFWLVVAAMAGIALAFIVPGLFSRRTRRGEGASRAALNAAVYRSQLADLDRDLEQGLLGSNEHAQASDEIRRRLLAETERAADVAQAASPRWAAYATAVLLPALAIGLYLLVGHPDALDAPEASSFVAAGPIRSRADMEAFVGQLESHVVAEPRDARAWALLGRARMALDRFEESAVAFERALAASPKVAADPMVWCEYADAVGMAQGGVLAGKPRTLIDRALAIKSDHPRALEMAGSAEYEAGNYAQAVFFWERLLPQLPDGSEARRELQAAIERTRLRAGTG
jgi:cytochrome c-type biogenesis protein CcmH